MPEGQVRSPHAYALVDTAYPGIDMSEVDRMSSRSISGEHAWRHRRISSFRYADDIHHLVT